MMFVLLGEKTTGSVTRDSAFAVRKRTSCHVRESEVWGSSTATVC